MQHPHSLRAVAPAGTHHLDSLLLPPLASSCLSFVYVCRHFEHRMFSNLALSVALAAGVLGFLVYKRYKESQTTTVAPGIDPARCTASHPRWFRRGANNVVTLTLADASGEPIADNITLLDVACTVDSSSVGWAVSTVSVEASTLTLVVYPDLNCTYETILRVVVWDTAISIPVKVSVSVSPCASLSLFISVCGYYYPLFPSKTHVMRPLLQAAALPATVATAKAACKHLHPNWWGAVHVADLSSLVAVCLPALSDPEVAVGLCDIVCRIP